MQTKRSKDREKDKTETKRKKKKRKTEVIKQNITTASQNKLTKYNKNQNITFSLVIFSPTYLKVLGKKNKN
jgi:hypothetical protein